MLRIIIVLTLALVAHGCGGDDEQKLNPLAPSPLAPSSMESAAPLGSNTSGAGNGGPVGLSPAAGTSRDSQVRGASPAAACVPKQDIVDAAERNRQANDRPPNHARNWRELLRFFGEDFPGVEPVTLAEMDARVERWSGWKPFRDEVARLIDCGWEPTTTIDVGSNDPMPQSVAQSWHATPSTTSITEGKSGTLIFKVGPTPAPGQNGCRFRGYMTFTNPSSGHPSGLSLSGAAPNAATLNGHPGWDDPNCGNTRLTSGADIGTRNYRLTYSSTSDGVAGNYEDIEVFFNDLPNDNNLDGGSANLVATISIVDDGVRPVTIVRHTCDHTHPQSGNMVWTEGDRRVEYPDGEWIEDDNIVQGDRCGTYNGIHFRAKDDDIAYVTFRSQPTHTTSQTNGSVQVNMTCKQWYEAIYTHNLGFNRGSVANMKTQFRNGTCVADISGGDDTTNPRFNGYVDNEVWDLLSWNGFSTSAEYPTVACSWLRGRTFPSSILYGHNGRGRSRPSLESAKDRLCTSYTRGTDKWTVDVSKPVKIAGTSWNVTYSKSPAPLAAISFSYSGDWRTGQNTSNGSAGPWELSTPPCGTLNKPPLQQVEPARPDQIILDPPSFGPCTAQ